MSNYLNAYKNYFLLQYSSLMKCFFPPSEILCCVFKFYWLSDEGIKHIDLIYILINEN